MKIDDFPRLRHATNADADAVKTLVFGVLREYGLSPAPGSTDADLEDIETNYRACGGSFDVLVLEDGRVVGSVGLYPMDGGMCEIRKMYLDAAWRGRGLGKRLLEHALGQARAMGFRRVVLETASVLREAIGLYASFGFRPFQSDHLAPRCDQAYCLDLQ